MYSSKFLNFQIVDLERKVTTRDTKPELLPKFEFLRSEAAGGSYDQVDRDFAFGSGKQTVAVPIKRINKKLSDIMTEIRTQSEAVRSHLSDFRLVFSEQSQEQAIVLQNFAKNFASLEQLCGEQSREFSR